MDVNTVLDILRTDYGISATEQSDTQLTRFITNAVRKLSEYYPFIEIGNAVTVAEQTRYQVTHTDLIKLKAVFTENIRNYQANTDLLLPEIPINGNNISSSNLSSGFALMQTIEVYRKLYPADATIVCHDTFEILPTPDRSGYKIIYEYERYREIDEIPEFFLDDLVDMVLFYIGDKKYKSTTLASASNTYWFDRRGAQTPRGESEKKTLVEMRKQIWDDIIASVQRKIKLI